MRSHGILVASIFALLSMPPAHSFSFIDHDRCAAKMSCVAKTPPQSPRPAMDMLRMSVKANALDVPAACVKNVMGQLDLAQLAVCEAFVAGNSGSPRQRATAWVNIGHAYVWLKDANAANTPIHALEYWDKAIAEDPTFAEPWALKGEVAIRGAQNKLTAIPFFEKAMALDPAHWRAMLRAT